MPTLYERLSAFTKAKEIEKEIEELMEQKNAGLGFWKELQIFNTIHELQKTLDELIEIVG